MTWNVLSWSRGHEFEPQSSRTWGAFYCVLSYLNQIYVILIYWSERKPCLQGSAKRVGRGWWVRQTDRHTDRSREGNYQIHVHFVCHWLLGHSLLPPLFTKKKNLHHSFYLQIKQVNIFADVINLLMSVNHPDRLHIISSSYPLDTIHSVLMRDVRVVCPRGGRYVIHYFAEIMYPLQSLLHCCYLWLANMWASSKKWYSVLYIVLFYSHIINFDTILL